jgi:hypothetical protein
MTRKSLTLINRSFFLISLLLPFSSFGADLWVNKNGNDSKNCLDNNLNACLSIKHALSKVVAGDSVNIGAGTYIEDSTSYSATQQCVWLDGDPVSLCITTNGTAANPINIQAAPGSEDKVIIDSELKRIGLQIQNYDHIHIRGLRFINNHIAGIASFGKQDENDPTDGINQDIASEVDVSIGVIIENNYIYNTNGGDGKNIAGIHMWGSQGWTVRNNIVDFVSKNKIPAIDHTSGIQAYGTVNALIENNYITNVGTGILWKDHYLADTARNPVDESEIRNNRINSVTIGVQLTAKGSGTNEAGRNYIHHNIFYNYVDTAILANIAHAYSYSTGLRIEHNIFDGSGNAKSIAIGNDAFIETTILGNIFIANKSDMIFPKEGTSGNWAKFNSSDYNLFDKNATEVVMDRYSDTQIVYNSLPEWQAARSADSESLNTDNPDKNSMSVDTSTLFINLKDRNYKYAQGSPALVMVTSDGTHPGPYNNQNEIIGVRSKTSRAPKPITQITAEPVY